MSRDDRLVDYAEPLIRLDALSKQIHDLCLHKSYAEAHKRIAEGITEFRILDVSLRLMQEKERG